MVRTVFLLAASAVAVGLAAYEVGAAFVRYFVSPLGAPR